MTSAQQHSQTTMFLFIACISLFLASHDGVTARTWRPTVTTTSRARHLQVRGGGSSFHHKSLSSLSIAATAMHSLKQSEYNNSPSMDIRGGSTTTRTRGHGGSIAFIPDHSFASIIPQEEEATANVTVIEGVIEGEVGLQQEASTTHNKRHKNIAKKLKNRNATNLRRKLLHASFGFFFAALNHVVPKAKFVPGMAVLTSVCLTVELLRYRKGFGWMNDAMHFFLGGSLRKHEMDGKFTGSFYYFLGVTITSWLYPTSCATLGICQLAIADPTASYFGRATRHVYWSRIQNGFGGLGRNKGILGFLGGALACVPMNYRLLSLAKFGANMAISQRSLWAASLALGVAGSFADLAVPTPTLTMPETICGVKVPPFHVDDNVVVPIFSGFACQHLFKLLQYPADLALAKYLVV